MEIEEQHIYVVGEFFAKYWAQSIPAAHTGASIDYAMHTYEHRVTKAQFVRNPELPTPSDTNYMCPEELRDVEIHFGVDPAGYGKPFRETLRFPIIGDVRLEGVVKERKRSYGTLRGRFFAKMHTTVME